MKTLKVGDRVRIEAVVRNVQNGLYDILFKGGNIHTSLNQSEADQAEIISEAKPELDQWEPTLSREYQAYVGNGEYVYGNYIGKHASGMYCLRNMDTGVITTHNCLQTIPPKPVTMEEELLISLQAGLWGADTCEVESLSKRLLPHLLRVITKHTIKMPSDEEIIQYYLKGSGSWRDLNIKTVRYFLTEYQKGGQPK